MNAPLLELRGLSVVYRPRRYVASARPVSALRSVDLEIHDGRSVGVVGESGCGKSTLARALLGLTKPTGGAVLWRGTAMDRADRDHVRRFRREIQAVFQDPFGSLDPRMTAGASVAEAIEALDGPSPDATVGARVAAAFQSVGLDDDLAARYPHELSGGQCQRVAIARATVVRPRLLVCDEAVSALDVSMQAQVVNLLADMNRAQGIALLFISHNLAVVRHLCHEVAVLYFGRVVEFADGNSLFLAPRHPYTRALLDAIPQLGPAARSRRRPDAPPEPGRWDGSSGGCAFAPRCPLAVDKCRRDRPELLATGEGGWVACHRWREGVGA